MAPRKSKKNAQSCAPPWFRVLRDMVLAADDERIDTSPVDIGRDPERDWWLHLEWDRGLDQVRDQAKELRKRREAHLLTSLLAIVDYVAWLKYLQKSCGFEAPRFMDFGSDKLRAKFRFIIFGEEDIADSDDEGSDDTGIDHDEEMAAGEEESGEESSDAGDQLFSIDWYNELELFFWQRVSAPDPERLQARNDARGEAGKDEADHTSTDSAASPRTTADVTVSHSGVFEKFDENAPRAAISPVDDGCAEL